MPVYYVNKNADRNGFHEVHESTCNWMPDPDNAQLVGVFPSCGPAKAEAKKIYPTADGCAHCSPACHTG